jgi:hypothetical protein
MPNLRIHVISIKFLSQPDTSNSLRFKIKKKVKFIFYKISKVKLDIIMDQNSTHKHPYFYVLLQLDCYEEILSLEWLLHSFEIKNWIFMIFFEHLYNHGFFKNSFEIELRVIYGSINAPLLILKIYRSIICYKNPYPCGSRGDKIWSNFCNF